jgi:hypothetical protein
MSVPLYYVNIYVGHSSYVSKVTSYVVAKQGPLSHGGGDYLLQYHYVHVGSGVCRISYLMGSIVFCLWGNYYLLTPNSYIY